MDGVTFDSLGFSKKLIQAGFSQGQAEALASLTAELEKVRIVERDKFGAKQKAELDKLEVVRKAEQEKLEAERRNTLATKADIMAVKADIMAVKADIMAVKADIMAVKDAMATKADMKDAEIRLLKWQIGIGVALVAIMAKGFGWLGF